MRIYDAIAWLDDRIIAGLCIAGRSIVESFAAYAVSVHCPDCINQYDNSIYQAEKKRAPQEKPDPWIMAINNVKDLKLLNLPRQKDLSEPEGLTHQSEISYCREPCYAEKGH